jgi:hypothetical protein
MKPGDIIFTYSGGIFSNLIRWITKRANNDVIMTHAAIAINANYFVETDITARISSIESLEKNRYYEIWSCQDLSDLEREIIVEKAKTYIDRIYSIPKILSHALDAIFGKITSRNIFFFRKIADSDKYIICSWIVSCVYTKVGFNFTEPYYIATPDNIHDFIKTYRRWILVKKKA